MDDRSEGCRRPAHVHVPLGGLWFAAWLFTVGYADLDVWRGVLAILIWPFYAGQAAA